MRWSSILVVLGVLSFASLCRAEDVPGRSWSASLGSSVGVTSNALGTADGSPDVVTELRGSLDYALAREGSSVEARVGWTGTRHRRFQIEDDDAITAAVGVGFTPAERWTARLAATYDHSSEGEGLAELLEPLGLRTRSNRFALKGEATFEPEPGTLLSAEWAVARQRFDATLFERGLLEPQRLFRDRDVLRFGFGASHSVGLAVLGLRSSFEAVRPADGGEEVPLTRSGLATLAAALELRGGGDGPRLAFEAGGQVLFDRESGRRRARPFLAISAGVPLTPRVALAGRIAQGFRIDDKDDPFAAFVRRTELEVLTRPFGRLALNAGAYSETERFLGLGTLVPTRGFYLEGVHPLRGGATARLRYDREAIDLGSTEDIVTETTAFGVTLAF